MKTLHLAVTDYRDPHHWYWRLTDDAGNFLGDREVKLNAADAEYEAFLDLPHYLSVHADPQNRRKDEARFTRQLGEWMGREFYGSIGDKILDAGTPVIVQVSVPAEASGLLYRPWELGYVRGVPLARQSVSLIFDPPEKPDKVNHEAVGQRLRILAVFSLPEGASALNLRQERYELAKTIRSIGQERGRAIDLRVLQYGVTRDVLKKAVEEGEGWDVVHFSGHGLQAHLILEKSDGSADHVPSDELAGLLEPARGRLKWVTLSACLSAAATVDETLRWLGVEPKRGTEAIAKTDALQAVARALVKTLDCAVLAMRYPVGDQFAIDLGRGLFEGVLEQGQPLTRALQITLPGAADEPDAAPVSVATPTLFGRYSARVEIAAPEGESPVRQGMSHFPDEPVRFVGRVGLLTKARGVMARDSKQTGLLFHGMSGGGKTACALELAYQYEDAKRFTHFLWYSAPKEGSDIEAALAGLARQWEIQIEDAKAPSFVAMVNSDDAKFAAGLPRLSTYLEQRSVLIVLDNIETLLRENGKWRDERWEKLIAALLDHNGPSRVVLTSRTRPQPSDARVLSLPVHSLSLQETALLARQLPNLGVLLRDEAHRKLVIRCLRLVQGHPELLKLAEAQSESAEKLKAHLERAEAAETAGEAELQAFFQTGESGLEPDGFLKSLYGWTKSVAATLTEEARLLFYRLCCMEEEDRQHKIIIAVWGEVAGEAAEIMTAGLIDPAYRIHPGVAEAARTEAGQELRDAVDARMAAAWVATHSAAVEKEAEGTGSMILRSARSAVPYLIRQHRWEEVQRLLESVTHRDSSPAILAEVLPLLGRAAEATNGTKLGLRSAGVFAAALGKAGRTEEFTNRMSLVERQAVEMGDLRIASAAAGELVNSLRIEGHFEEALIVIERKKEHTRKAALGRWTQLADETYRFQILNELGRHEDVLTAVQELREEIKSLPDSTGRGEAVVPWNVREIILNTGCVAALRLKRWEDCLSLNDELVNAKVNRGATRLEA